MDKTYGYWAVMPAEILHSNISNGAKVLYLHISALASKNGYCFASNGFFEKQMKCSQMTLNRMFRELEINNFVFREMIYEEGTHHIIERRIGIIKNDYRSVIKNDYDNSIKVNTIKDGILQEDTDEQLLATRDDRFAHI
jgi:hypothetical protein